MLAGGEDHFGQFKMGMGGGDDAERVRSLEGVAEGGENGDLVFLGDFRRLLWRDIVHAGKAYLSPRSQFRINAGVFLAKGTYPQDSNLKLVRHGNECTVDDLRLTSLKFVRLRRNGFGGTSPPANHFDSL
jgi:hypothetical protein